MRRIQLPLRLAARLTLTFGIGATFVASVLAGSAYFLSRHYLVQQQQHTVLHQAFFNAEVVKTGLQVQSPDVPGVLDNLPAGTSTQAVIEHHGRWYSSSLTISRDALPVAIKSATLNQHAVQSWIRINGVPELVVGVALPAVDGAFFQVTDESSLGRTLAVLRTVLTTAAALAAAAGIALGWWASRRLTAPMRAVAAAAERIAGGDLGTHLPAESDAELGGLVDSFNAMVEALRERIERDSRFAADVSHELRSPLTTLTTSLAVLEGRRDELSERGKSALTLLSSEVSRFQRLVEDLLEISRAAAAGADREQIQVGELVLHLAGDPRYQKITADIDSRTLNCVVVGDKRRLVQAVRNLLDNAQIHGGGATRIAVQPCELGIAVVVDDAGPGIPPLEAERIFDRFARGRSARRRGSGSGTGLGLAIVREHARWHGGDVFAGTRPGGGARFTLELPVSAPR